MKKLRLSKKIAPYVFISPFYLFFAVFGAFPILFALYLSFFNWDGMNPMQFVGLENYQFVLTDAWFWDALYNTVSIAIMTTIPQHVIGLLLAFLLTKVVGKFKSLLRTSYFLPYVIMPVAVAFIFTPFFGFPYGLLNSLVANILNLPLIGGLLESLGLTFPLRWTSDPNLIRPSISLLLTWRFTGFNMIIYYAGLQQIPESLYEAAKVDGATMFQTFFKVTLPLLRPVMFFAMLMSIIGNLQIFDEPMILVGLGGGTGRAGQTAMMYMYQTAFNWREFGTGSAMAYIMFFIIIVASLLFNKFFDREI